MPVDKREYTKKGLPVWFYEFKHDKIRYHKTGFATKKEADNAEATKRREILDKRQRPLDPKYITLDDLLPKFFEYRAVDSAPGTVSREKPRSRPLIAFFHNKLLSIINIGDVQDYVVKRKKDGLKPRSINLELTLLRSVCKYAIQNNYATTNPARDVKNLRVTTEEKWIPTKVELEKFIKCASKTYSGKVLVPWTWFMAYVGTRPTEAFFMEWKDIDFEDNLIYVRPKEENQLKNRKFRVIDMHPELKSILLEYRKTWNEVFEVRAKRHPDEVSPPHDFVFYNPKTQTEKVVSFNKCFYHARKEAGLPKLTMHGLRHFFISYCVMSGVSFFTIAKWVGHSSTKMIEETYGHLAPNYKAEEMKKLSFDIKKKSVA